MRFTDAPRSYPDNIPSVKNAERSIQNQNTTSVKEPFENTLSHYGKMSVILSIGRWTETVIAGMTETNTDREFRQGSKPFRTV